MKALVFGGSGFIGSHVADRLTEVGYEVIVFDLKPSPYLLPGQGHGIVYAQEPFLPCFSPVKRLL